LAPYRFLEEVGDDPETEHFVRIAEADGDRQITVIELVSPTNKRGDGAVAFRARRHMFFDSGVNVVDIDLVRAGNWLRLLQPAHCPEELRTAYRVTYRLPRDPGVVHYKPIHLREPLPTIAVPLRENDPEVSLRLQELIDRVYDGGRYSRRINYASPLPVPPGGDDERWADELLRAAGKRP
jgi:hypothetical protein